MHVLGVAMIQKFSLKKGLNKFGTRGENSVTKYLNQLHDMQTYFPLESKTLTKEQQEEALGSFMFLMYKLNWGIKSKEYADDSKKAHTRRL